MSVCNFVEMAKLWEPFFPYFVYCCSILLMYLKFVANSNYQDRSLQNFYISLKLGATKGISSLLLKFSVFLLIGGSFFLSIGAWLCK